MKKILTIIFMAATAVILTGCAEVEQHFMQMADEVDPAIVLESGFKINVNGQSVPVYGEDECPRMSPTMALLFGEMMDTSDTCIVLSKSRETVIVTLALPPTQKGATPSLVTEVWKIEREYAKPGERRYGRTSLRRQDGSLVVPAES